MKWIKFDDAAVIPTKAHSTDGAYDLSCLEDFSLVPGETKLVRTGIGIEWDTRQFTIDGANYGVLEPPIPFAFVLPRSGLAAKHNITVVNSPGLIDYGYTGEISVILHKLYTLDGEVTTFKSGNRIAQLLFSTTSSVRFDGSVTPSEVGNSIRGSNGFGSTGV